VRHSDGHGLGIITDGTALGDVFVLDHRGQPLAMLYCDDCGGEGGLAVVDVTDGTHVHVGLRSVEGFFSHVSYRFLFFVSESRI
jgi:hypothetical protein